jgi:hypothetical protein
MIIESGIDVLQALCGSVSSDNPDGVWIVAMDENLRLLYVDPVVRQVVGDVEQHVDDIAQYLEAARDIAYYALGWTSPVEVDNESTWLADVDRRLHDDPGLAVARLLGIIVFDRSSLYASLPRCDFSIERGFQDLPRAMALAGPHGLDCSCPPCAAERREFDAAYDYEPYDYEPYDYRPSDYEAYDDYPTYGDHPAGYGGPGGPGGSTGYRPSRRRRRRGRPRLYDPDYEQPTSLDIPRFDEFSNSWYPPPARAGKRWTRDEEQTIVLSHEQGLSCFDISLLVLRQPGAVASRLNKLGLSSATVVRSL